MSIIESLPNFDATLYWAYCLECKEPMFGVEKEWPQTFDCECPVCGEVNVFSNSAQPVTHRSSENPESLPPSHIQDNAPGTL